MYILVICTLEIIVSLDFKYSQLVVRYRTSALFSYRNVTAVIL